MSKNAKASFWAVVNAALTTLAMQMADGKVPVPEVVLWLVPIAVAMITALSPYIKQEEELSK